MFYVPVTATMATIKCKFVTLTSLFYAGMGGRKGRDGVFPATSCKLRYIGRIYVSAVKPHGLNIYLTLIQLKSQLQFLCLIYYVWFKFKINVG